MRLTPNVDQMPELAEEQCYRSPIGLRVIHDNAQ
jgi:hypothetical protein